MKADSTLYTSFETGVYYAYEELKAIPEDIQLITVSAPYYANDGKLTALNQLAGEFISEANQLSDKSYSLSAQSMETIAKAIAGAVQTVVPAGSTIVDFMGKDTTPEAYDFDLVTTASVTPESSRISIHTPSASSGKITSRSAADTQKLAPCSARRKSA